MNNEPIFSSLTTKDPCNANCPPGDAVYWSVSFPATTYQDCVDYQTELGNPVASADCCQCVFDGG